MDVGAELKRKLGPFPLYVWLLALTGLALVVYVVRKRKGSAGQTGTPGTPCTMSDGSSGTWDSTGTVCQATTVSTVNVPTGVATDFMAGAATATTTPAATAAASTPAAVGATVPPTGNPITTGLGTGNPNAGNWSFPPPEPVKVTGASKTSTQLKISWPAVKGPGGQVPASYRVRIFRDGQQIRDNSVAGTSYTESGLSKGTTGLTINVWAEGGPLAPAHGSAST